MQGETVKPEQDATNVESAEMPATQDLVWAALQNAPARTRPLSVAQLANRELAMADVRARRCVDVDAELNANL